MDWLLYDNGLRNERVNPFHATASFYTPPYELTDRDSEYTMSFSFFTITVYHFYTDNHDTKESFCFLIGETKINLFRAITNVIYDFNIPMYVICMKPVLLSVS